MRKLKKINRLSAAAFCCGVLALLMALGTFALAEGETNTYTIPEMDDMTVEIPGDMYVFTQQSQFNDPNFAAAGIENSLETLKRYKDNNIYLNAVSKDGRISITIAKNDNSATREVFSLALLDKAAFDEFLEKLRTDMQGDTNLTDYSVEAYAHAQQPFFKTSLTAAPPGQQEATETVYSTIINGYTVAIDSYMTGGPLPEGTDELLRQITDSAKFPVVKEKPPAAEEPPAYALLILLAPLLAIALLVLVPLLISHLVQKKNQQRRKEITDRLAAYHKEQEEREAKAREEGIALPEPSTLFVNETEYTDAALVRFSLFYGVQKRIVSIIVYIIIGVVALLTCFVTEGSFISKAILALLGVFCIVWPIMLPRKIYKNQASICRVTFKSRKAVYSFREDDFRVNGLQAVSVYPYFQISTVYETGGYIYLYFNDNQVYYLAKGGFTKGELDSFRTFLRDKLGKYYKRYPF